MTTSTDESQTPEKDTINSGEQDQFAAKYPGGQVCLDEAIRYYDRILAAYDHIYERASYCFALCNLVFIGGMSLVDKNLLDQLSSCLREADTKVFLVLGCLIIGILGIIIEMVAIVILILVLRNKQFPAVSIVDLYNKKKYEHSAQLCATHLFQLYCDTSIKGIAVLEEKQKLLNIGIGCELAGFILIVLSMFVKNIGGF